MYDEKRFYENGTLEKRVKIFIYSTLSIIYYMFLFFMLFLFPIFFFMILVYAFGPKNSEFLKAIYFSGKIVITNFLCLIVFYYFKMKFEKRMEPWNIM